MISRTRTVALLDTVGFDPMVAMPFCDKLSNDQISAESEFYIYISYIEQLTMK